MIVSSVRDGFSPAELRVVVLGVGYGGLAKVRYPGGGGDLFVQVDWLDAPAREVCAAVAARRAPGVLSFAEYRVLERLASVSDLVGVFDRDHPGLSAEQVAGVRARLVGHGLVRRLPGSEGGDRVSKSPAWVATRAGRLEVARHRTLVVPVAVDDRRAG